MLIRTATPDDFAILPVIEQSAASVFAQHGLDAISCMPPQPVGYYHTLPVPSVILVAENSASDCTGFAVGIVVDNQAHLRELSVKPEESGKGYGSALLKAVIQWAQDRRFSHLTLTTFRDIPFNGIFYRKIGFEEFTPDPVSWPELYTLRQAEIRNGLDIKPRTAMILKL